MGIPRSFFVLKYEFLMPIHLLLLLADTSYHSAIAQERSDYQRAIQRGVICKWRRAAIQVLENWPSTTTQRQDIFLGVQNPVLIVIITLSQKRHSYQSSCLSGAPSIHRQVANGTSRAWDLDWQRYAIH